MPSLRAPAALGKLGHAGVHAGRWPCFSIFDVFKSCLQYSVAILVLTALQHAEVEDEEQELSLHLKATYWQWTLQARHSSCESK